MSIGAAALFEQRIEVKSWLSDFFFGGRIQCSREKRARTRAQDEMVSACLQLLENREEGSLSVTNDM